MSEQGMLERRYRRLLACYPRTFRRKNEEEILAVLLAFAQDGQQRPGLAASGDLIKGAARAWLCPAQGQPRRARIATWLMCAGAAAQLAHLITVVTTAGSVRADVARGHPSLAAQHAVDVGLVVYYIGASIGIVVWLMLAWALIRGRGRARIALAAFAGVMTFSMLLALGEGSAAYALDDVIAGAVVWLIAIAASMLLFTMTSGGFYHAKPRTPTPWTGTFGGS